MFMFKRRDPGRRGRKGASAMIMAVSAPVVIGASALAINTAVLGVSRSQLQTAADAAALAGAAQLEHDVVTQAQVTAAGNAAVAFASKNAVLGTEVGLQANPNNVNDGTYDLVVGYVDPAVSTKTLQVDSSHISQYNAVKVSATRSTSHGGQIPTYFFGSGADMTVSSTAAVMAMNGFQYIDGSTSINCLPIVLDSTTATSMFNGSTTDLYAYNTSSGAVTSGSDGVTESKAYPVKNGSPGNWGTVQIGVTNNSTSTLSDQILNGISPAQMATFSGGVMKLDTSGSLVLSGNPGISAGIKSALISIIGQTRWMPVYDASRSGGSGNNTYYTITSFAPVRIMAVVFAGSKKYLVVQPATISRSNSTLYWSTRAAGTLPTSYKVHLIH